jgi:hypothetical protein
MFIFDVIVSFFFVDSNYSVILILVGDFILREYRDSTGRNRGNSTSQ